MSREMGESRLVMVDKMEIMYFASKEKTYPGNIYTGPKEDERERFWGKCQQASRGG